MSQSDSSEESWTLVDKNGYEMENSAVQTENSTLPVEFKGNLEEISSEMSEIEPEIAVEAESDEVQVATEIITEELVVETPKAAEVESEVDANGVGQIVDAEPFEVENVESISRSSSSKSSIDHITDDNMVEAPMEDEISSPSCSYPLEFTIGDKSDVHHDSFESDDSDLSIIEVDKQQQPRVSDLDGNPDLQLLLAQFKARFCQPYEQHPESIGQVPSNASLNTFSDDLPVNFVQMCSNRMRNYIHTYNSPLNWKLTLLVALATACCLGLGIGHFVGHTSSWLIRRAKNRSEELRQTKVMLNNLRMCEANMAELNVKHAASLDELKKELTTCRFKQEHGVKEDSYCRRDELASERKDANCQMEVSTLKSSVEHKQHQVALLQQQVENLAAELVYYSQAHRESIGRITRLELSEQSLDRRLQKFFKTLDILFERNDIAPLDNINESAELSSETKLLHLEAQILHMVAQFERQVKQLQRDSDREKLDRIERNGWLTKLMLMKEKSGIEAAASDDVKTKCPEPKSADPFNQVRSYLLEMTERLKTQFSAYSWLLRNLTGDQPSEAGPTESDEPNFPEKLVSYLEEFRQSVMNKLNRLNTEESKKKIADQMEEIGSQAQSIVDPMMDLAQKGAKNIGDMVKAVWNLNNEKIAEVQRKHQKIFDRFKDRVKQPWEWEKLSGDWMNLFNRVFWTASNDANQDDFEFDLNRETVKEEEKPIDNNQFCPKSQKIATSTPIPTEDGVKTEDSWMFSRAEKRRKQRESEQLAEEKSDWLYKRSKGRKDRRWEDDKKLTEATKAGWIFKRGRGRDMYRRGKG